MSAHNLQTKMSYMFFDKETQDFLDARIEGTSTEVPPYGGPPEPLLRMGDELGMVIKVIPRDGTTTGVGGHVDFYIPNGTQVVDVGYLNPDGSGNYLKVPMKGQSLIAIGDGPIGAKATAELIGLAGTYTNINGVTEAPVVSATGVHRGTISGVYGDTGIFYSTDPNTSYGSWQRLTNSSNPASESLCGVSYSIPNFAGSGSKTITNNSGDVVVPCNAWDAGQLYAWGAKGTTYTGPGASSAPIVDYSDGRGNAPWGFASGVAGPENGYRWAFDWFEWSASSKTGADMQEAMDPTESVGPWNRIEYAGDRVSDDQAGLKSTVLGMASKDAGDLGIPVSSLPPTTSQSDTSSPKAIRWAVGQLTTLVPEYVWVKIRVNDTTAILNEDGCPILHADTFGGDAGGSDNGKDHLWRYYEPTQYLLNGCVAIGKDADKPAVSSGETFHYNIKLYNLGTEIMTNVFVRDLLPSGVTFISSVPAQNSGPNPLVWYLTDLQPGEKFEAVVTVKATSTGVLTNKVCADSDQQDSCAEEDTPSGSYAILRQIKNVVPENVAPGGSVTYTIYIDNVGSGPSGSPIKIEEHLDSVLSYASLTNVTLNGANVTGSTTVNSTDPRNPVFTVPGSIQADKALTITFTALVSPGAEPGEYCNWYTSYAPTIPSSTGSLACLNVAGGKIGDFIWRDWNGDGVQDPAEEGIAGVTVELYDSTGTTLLATTTTDANGLYYFNGVTAGTYMVMVDTATIPAGYGQTGDPDGTMDHAHTVILAENQQYLTADFGYRPGGAGAIGDTVFEDVANNGLYDAGTDTGIAGVTVYLYEDSNGNGIVDSGTDALIGTTTTDGTGYYLFSNLAEGFDYIAWVDENDPALAAYFSSDPYQPSTPIPQPVDNLTGNYLDADFGFWQVSPSSIGDEVFIDENGNGIYDAGETRVPFITVSLYLDGSLVQTTQTDGSGMYLFDNLGPGNYSVVMDTEDADLPAGYFPTTTSYSIALPAGTDVLYADFPLTGAITKAVDKLISAAGETLTYTIIPRFPTFDVLPSITVQDTIPTGTTYVAASANLGGEGIDQDDPADGIIDYVLWDLGSNTPGVQGYTGGTPPPACAQTVSVTAAEDTDIDEDNPINNKGTDNRLRTQPAMQTICAMPC